jgi:hypothetical protein
MQKGVHRILSDHFEPEPDLDPQAQRRMRATLETIDTIAFEANKAALAADLPTVTLHQIEEMAAIAARARSVWLSASIISAGQKSVLDGRGQLAALRVNYEEWSTAYEALRRAIERGYVRMA